MINNLRSSPLPLNEFSVLTACYQLHCPAYLHHGVARASRVTADPRKSMLPLPTLHTEHIPTKKLYQLLISLSLIDLMRIIYKSYWNQSNVTPLCHHPLVEQPDGFCKVCWAYCFLLPLKQLNYPCAIWYLAVLVDLCCLSAALGCLWPRSTEPKHTGRRPRARCSSPEFKAGNIWILASRSATDSQPPLAWAESLFLQAAECLHTQTHTDHS